MEAQEKNKISVIKLNAIKKANGKRTGDGVDGMIE